MYLEEISGIYRGVGHIKFKLKFGFSVDECFDEYATFSLCELEAILDRKGVPMERSLKDRLSKHYGIDTWDMITELMELDRGVL